MQEQPWWQQILDKILPAHAGGGFSTGKLIGGAIGVLIILLVLRRLKRMLFGVRPGPAQEHGVYEEDLAEFPPPPPGSKRVLVEGMPARLRLVVVAPVGKDNPIDIKDVEAMLDQILYGLGELARQDRPRIRVWPAQLSNQGFSITFNRMMKRPEPPGKLSRWVMVAGQTQPRPRKMMLGLALLADKPNSINHLNPNPEQWSTILKV